MTAASPPDPNEFKCTECGRTIWRVPLGQVPATLCAECIFIPGWFKDPKLRAILDPGYDRTEG